ncbi:MAG: tetratricopeptide repeat protein [Desertifilum sp. SIO1I2]|nr:tetratricopeptide repeat protein [Desertifilum sp. SIO1I2]
MLDDVRDRYFALIDRIVEITLKGQIRSKEQVYQMLVDEIESETGEIFESCLDERQREVQHQIDNGLQAATATRRQRALKTIQGEWERWQKENRVSAAIASATQQILAAPPEERLLAVVKIIDPNRSHPLTLEQLQQLAKALQQLPKFDSTLSEQLQQVASGIMRGIQAWQRLEGDLVSWMYERGSIGFSGTPGQNGPWSLWGKLVQSPFPQQVFETLALEQSLAAFAAKPRDLDVTSWIELAVILQCLQRGLIQFFDQRVYAAKLGAKLSISTFLTFAVIWSLLANGFNQRGSTQVYGNGCFQIALQILRTFSQREYFPLYGGIFASFTGRYLRDTLSYLDEPLRQAEGTQEKARILTLIGYSRRAQGAYQEAIAFHQQALAISQQAGDRMCEVANYNHLSRICVAQKNYSEAINYSQRALILSRQTGDKLGEANALANLGYSEVFQARQQDQIEPEIYDTAIRYLQQGLSLSEQLAERQSQALCLSSLGIAYVIADQSQTAIQYLSQGLQTAQFSGDLYLQGLNLAYLAEAYYNLGDREQAIFTGSLGMYLLEQIGATEWRQPAGLLSILQGQIGTEVFLQTLLQNRAKIIPIIGVDGYDHIPQLLERYRQS